MVERAKHIEALEARVAEAKDLLHMSIRDDATDVDHINGAIQVLEDAQSALVQELAKPAKVADALAEVARIDADAATAKAIAQARVQVKKATNRFERNTSKLERAIEIISEAFAGLVKTSGDAIGELHAKDRDTVITRAYAKFAHNLLYSLQVQLTASGVPLVTETSVVRSHQKSISPRSVVEGFTKMVCKDA